MSAGTSELFYLICLLVCSCTAETNFKAELGQDLSLSWTIPEENNPITAVECCRPEMKAKYVLSYRDGRLDPENQHPSYKNRVDLQDKEMKDGKFTLILKNVNMEDTGTYECHIYENKTCSWIRSIWERSRWRIESIISIFNLEVVEPDL
ncbi:myelin-oligodendrocyte glycoprotein-like isoform X2 [Amphiprion ocellaris]|uniref:myelin-oligodendrocyte glycoprotein-like isoform X2 n=1 Tax=Amphiprion ocellaris TaxID=80972 RepID=UPI001649E764|nr:myelin-oligodendrocyte glycoprotein-like isoform X2 [Amphiprion ocellaris]